MNQFDHFVLAAPDLDAAKNEFERQTGCLPVNGGAHTGLGTRNALASFGNGSYLEIIAPDPAQSAANNMGARLAQLPGMTPLHWAVRVDNLTSVAERAASVGLTPGPIIDTSRTQPDSQQLHWQLMGLRGGHAFGGLVPFYIDWLDCPHPATTTPVAGTFRRFEVHLPAGPVHQLLDGVGGVTVVEGEPEMVFEFDTPKGIVGYQAQTLTGFTL